MDFFETVEADVDLTFFLGFSSSEVGIASDSSSATIRGRLEEALFADVATIEVRGFLTGVGFRAVAAPFFLPFLSLSEDASNESLSSDWLLERIRAFLAFGPVVDSTGLTLIGGTAVFVVPRKDDDGTGFKGAGFSSSLSDDSRTLLLRFAVVATGIASF